MGGEGRLGRRRRSMVFALAGVGRGGKGDWEGKEGMEGRTPPAASWITRMKELSRGRWGEAHLL